jgi:hypothetical protein
MANSRLTRNISSGSTTNKFTLSFWIKKSATHTNDEWLFENYNSGSARTWVRFNLDTGNPRLEVSEYTGSYIFRKITNRVFRDVGAFYHIHIQFDSTQGTEADRLKIYINGVQETSFAQTNHPAQNATSIIANTGNQHIGYSENIGGAYFSGYMSHTAFVQGSALAPTVFGQTDSTSGIWKFKSPSGVTWGTNGFHLKFENSAALGTDSSGNSNTFTVNGNLKQSLDTPSNVYCTINPLDNYIANATLTNGNTTVATGSGNPSWNYITSTLGVSTGKWYWEVKDTTNNSSILGFAAKLTTSTGDQLGESSAQWGVQPNGRFRSAGSDLAGVGTFSFGQNDIVGIALDATNKKVYFHTNGTYGNSGNPSTGANGITIASPDVGGGFGWYFPAFGDGNTSSDTYHVNFGNGYFGTTAITSAGSNGNGSLFEYDVPSGYYALNTKNINTYG